MNTFKRHLNLVLLPSLLLLSTSAGWTAVEDNNPHGPLSVACNACHTTEGWTHLRPDLDFDHQQTAFPLVGRHEGVSCRACHTSLVFADAGTNCRDCHLDVHRGQFAQNNCEDCHTPVKWNNEEQMLERHQQTRFPLIGVHASLDCQQCHANGQYVNLAVECKGCHLATYEKATTPSHAQGGLPTDCELCHTITAANWSGATFSHAMTAAACYTCHEADYERVTDPNHVSGQFSHDCAGCHTTTAWQPANFDHNFTAFPLTGAHVSVNCAECHVNGQFAGTTTECYGCHQSNYEGVTDPNHVAGNYDHNCTVCHTTGGWTPASFDHNNSGFPLTGAHLTVSCAQCHVNGQFNGTTTECYGCHQADYDGSTDPNHVANQFPHECAECHSTDAWQPSTFNHDATQFPLTGAHIEVNCAECHQNGQYAGTPTDCYTCHQADYEGVSDPNHVAGQYDHNCTVCHTTDAWSPASFDHGGTAFPLTGAHVNASCTQCHVNGQFAGTPTECFACHESDYNGASNPDHASNQYPHDCAVCHSTAAWQPSNFDHNQTQFPLTGAHITVNCGQCHVNGQFQGTPTDCWSCHQQDYENTDDPNHVQLGFSHDCTECHTTDSWEGGGFDHSGTDFPLTGAHVDLACAQCHINGQYQGTPTDCWSCHEADYQGASSPDHASNQYPHDCAVCHSTAAWQPSTFDHGQTQFPLTGAHVTVNCAQCHINGQFQGTPTDCWSCHESDYQSASNPEHASNQYPHDCAICHNTVGWQPSTFDHSQTQFPLTGAHITVNCAQCHVNGQFQGTPTDCWSCHQQDYENTDDPNHVQLQFSHDCTECHNTDSWEGGDFDHSGTDFPLTGAHLNLSCAQCHINGQYQGTPTDCWSCHQADYEGVTDPNHVSGQYDHNCAVCHSTNGWSPATFDHSGTNFPLTGAHVDASCTQCHVNGQFQGTPTECFFCHEADYNNANDPNHLGAGFPTTCEQCHTTFNWNSTFNHDPIFPIYSGRHQGRWDHCSDCHPSPNDYGQFTCFTCHSEGSMNNEHSGVQGYVYENSACLACHPDGGGGDFRRPPAVPNQK